MKRCLLISGGEYSPIEKNEKYDLIIACDKGLEYAEKMGITPDILIGDFDSYKGKMPDDIETIHLNPIKDDTDTISAVRFALDKGCDEIHIACAFGGRLDHTIANVQTAAFIHENGARPVISGKNSVLYILENDVMTLKREPDSYFSVFSLSEKCENVNITGAKYNVQNGTITSSYPIGVSNEWTEDAAVISVGSGRAAVLIIKKDQP